VTCRKFHTYDPHMLVTTIIRHGDQGPGICSPLFYSVVRPLVTAIRSTRLFISLKSLNILKSNRSESYTPLNTGCSFSFVTDKGRLDSLIIFIDISKCYHHCDRLSSSSHRLLKLADTRRKTQRWQTAWRSAELAFIGPALKDTPYIEHTVHCTVQLIRSIKFSPYLELLTHTFLHHADGISLLQ